MKYLKRFNENNDSIFYEDVKYLRDIFLELGDVGFVVSCFIVKFKTTKFADIEVVIKKSDGFIIEDIKEDVLTSIGYMNSKNYSLVDSNISDTYCLNQYEIEPEYWNNIEDEVKFFQSHAGVSDLYKVVLLFKKELV